MAKLYKHYPISDTSLHQFRNLLEDIQFGESCIVIEFVAHTPEQELDFVEQLDTMLIERSLSQFFPYPVYVLSKSSLKHPKFMYIPSLSALPLFYRREILPAPKEQFNKSKLIKKQFANIDSNGNIRGLEQRAETIRELKECDEQIHFLQGIKDQL